MNFFKVSPAEEPMDMAHIYRMDDAISNTITEYMLENDLLYTYPSIRKLLSETSIIDRIKELILAFYRAKELPILVDLNKLPPEYFIYFILATQLVDLKVNEEKFNITFDNNGYRELNGKLMDAIYTTDPLSELQKHDLLQKSIKAANYAIRRPGKVTNPSSVHGKSAAKATYDQFLSAPGHDAVKEWSRGNRPVDETRGLFDPAIAAAKTAWTMGEMVHQSRRTQALPPSERRHEKGTGKKQKKSKKQRKLNKSKKQRKTMRK